MEQKESAIFLSLSLSAGNALSLTVTLELFVLFRSHLCIMRGTRPPRLPITSTSRSTRSIQILPTPSALLKGCVRVLHETVAFGDTRSGSQKYEIILLTCLNIYMNFNISYKYEIFHTPKKNIPDRRDLVWVWPVTQQKNTTFKRNSKLLVLTRKMHLVLAINTHHECFASLENSDGASRCL